jgi:hypothetical protein
MRILGIAALCAALAGCASGPSRPLLAQNEFSGSTPPVYQPLASEPQVTCPDGSIATSQEICAVAITEAPSRQHPAQSARAATRVTSIDQPGPRPTQAPISAPAISAAPPATDKREAQVLSAIAIAALIVKESRSAYYATGRPCACPDDRMRNGHACGGRSAYSRPGGAAPLCYPADVSTEMISNYRARLAQR